MSVAAPAGLLLAPSSLTGAEIPDPDRVTPAGLVWVAPVDEAGPIVLGPSADHPVLHPLLAIEAGRFWAGARHGLSIGRTRREMDAAALEYALSADLSHASHLAAALAEATAAWVATINDYTKELAP